MSRKDDQMRAMRYEELITGARNATAGWPRAEIRRYWSGLRRQRWNIEEAVASRLPGLHGEEATMFAKEVARGKISPRHPKLRGLTRLARKARDAYVEGDRLGMLLVNCVTRASAVSFVRLLGHDPEHRVELWRAPIGYFLVSHTATGTGRDRLWQAVVFVSDETGQELAPAHPLTQVDSVSIGFRVSAEEISACLAALTKPQVLNTVRGFLAGQ
jgi:hypothetical protein